MVAQQRPVTPWPSAHGLALGVKALPNVGQGPSAGQVTQTPEQPGIEGHGPELDGADLGLGVLILHPELIHIHKLPDLPQRDFEISLWHYVYISSH